MFSGDRLQALLRPVITVCLGVCCLAALADDEPDEHFLAFLNALGEPALIGANADHALADTAYRPLPAWRAVDLDVEKLRLGRDLFHDRQLSVDNSVGCNSCHSGMAGGADRRSVSVGVGGALGTLNSPTVLNAAFNFRQLWDGGALDLREQALGPIEDPHEMAHSLDAALDMLQEDADYGDLFAKVYPDGVTAHNLADALAYFQTVTFTRAGTPFVQHLNGVERQLSDQALRGWQRFDDIGCASCHNGINLGGNSYQQLGALLPYFGEHRPASARDEGLRARSGREADGHVFKVPSLHNIAETGPYFHDGSISSLESAIEEMAEHQLGRLLDEDELAEIAAFLRALSGRPAEQPNTLQGPVAIVERTSSIIQPGSRIAALLAQQNHDERYLESIGVAELAITRLLGEMQRIHEQRVAHYDFLQFEHLELIRHASALRHPPRAMPAARRAALAATAEQLYAAAMALEWIIADFLRAEAQLRVIDRQLAFPAAQQNLLWPEDPPVARHDHHQQAQSLIRAMADSPVPELARSMSQYVAQSAQGAALPLSGAP